MKPTTKKTLSVYWLFCRKYKKSGLLLVFSTLLYEILENIAPLFYKSLINLIATGGSKELILGSALKIVGGLFAVYLVIWVARRVSAFVANYFESAIIADLNVFCYAYLHHHSFSFFNNNFVGSLVKRVKWFVSAFESVADRVLWDLLPMIVSIVIVIGILGSINIWLALGLVVWMVVFLAVNWWFANYKIKFDLKRNEAETENSGLLADTITNNANVKLFNGYDREVDSYINSSEKLRFWRKRSWDVGSLFDAIQGFLAVSLEVAILYFAVTLWQKNLITIGDFALIQAYLINIINRIWGFGNVMRRLFTSLSDAEEMTVMLETPHEIQDVLNAKKLKIKTGGIEFKDVDFKYHTNRKILNNFNLTVTAGEKVALIGPSGAGKTTVIKLLLRMHDLTGGKILIDGQDISQVTQESLWQSVSLVPQDPILFHRTLKDNIRYGKPGASDKQVIEAAKRAHCHEFISQLEHGYDTFVGERGIKLSGGERQRVAIARAILRNAPILVLDEATSSLDSESEHLIQEALDELMKNKTVLVIAHRLSTIRHVDRIIVIDKGKVVEEGTHGDLTNQKGGIYSKLWQLQAGGFASPTKFF